VQCFSLPDALVSLFCLAAGRSGTATQWFYRAGDQHLFGRGLQPGRVAGFSATDEFVGSRPGDPDGGAKSGELGTVALGVA
jgi:hypothetical protein